MSKPHSFVGSSRKGSRQGAVRGPPATFRDPIVTGFHQKGAARARCDTVFVMPHCNFPECVYTQYSLRRFVPCAKAGRVC
jgi:hypothetical protein